MKKKEKNTSKIMWIIMGIGAAFLVGVIFLSSIISVGEKVRQIHPYLEYGFYGISAILIYILILNPVRIIFLSPSFSIQNVMDEEGKKNYKLYKKITNNIINSNVLKEEENKFLKDSLGNYEQLKIALNTIYNSSLKREINKCIINNAKTVMLSTALCPNGRMDFITTISVNLKMIKEIVVMCGFRPNFKNLAKLSINIAGTALIAEGLEDMNIEELLPNSVTNAIGEIPLIKPVISGITQGIANALLTVRIGVVCRKYLFKEGEEITKEAIRKSALKESVKLLPTVTKDVLAMFPNKIMKLFGLGKKTTEEELA